MNEQSMTFAPIEPSEFDKLWIEQQERLQREIATAFAIPAQEVGAFQPSGAILLKGLLSLEGFEILRDILIADWTPQWVISPKTYEFIKLAHLFPIPVRKLRKVQLRRITKRKQQYRKHRARVNAAIAKRMRAN